MNHIDLEPKTDREILLIIAGKCNQMSDDVVEIKGVIKNHENRIIHLESGGGCNEKEKSWKSTLKVNWQVLSLLASLLALIILELS